MDTFQVTTVLFSDWDPHGTIILGPYWTPNGKYVIAGDAWTIKVHRSETWECVFQTKLHEIVNKVINKKVY